jgi:hypothetical protein
MPNNIVHFDSIYSQYVQPGNDPFNTNFKLDCPVEGNSNIYLKSVELPINFYNVRSGSTMNQIIMTTNLGNTYTVSIAAGNYTTISSLLTVINNAFSGVVPSTTVTFTTSGYKINVTAVSTSITSFSLTSTILSTYILGFRNTTFSGLSTTGAVDYFINPDNYIVMYLSNVPTNNTAANGNLTLSFKIPLPSAYGNVLYISEGSSMRQYIGTMSGGQTITSLKVQIYDRFGNLITANNNDYSFTLEFEKF